MMTMRAFGSPRLYLQGPGLLDRAAEALAAIGERPFAVVDPVVLERMGNRVAAALPGATLARFSGEITAAEIERLAAEAAKAKPGVIVGIGGGKAIDTAKGVSLALGLPIAIMPTAASNDAPTSRVIVVYDEAHRIAELRRLPANPDLVLVDTAIIAAAPKRLLAAGIGDAMSKAFEAHACADAGGMNFFGGSPPIAALALADACLATLRRDAAAAMEAAGTGQPNVALENVVEAAVLLSGLGFEAGGLSLAHALTRGFTAHAATAGAMHGEMVAYGTIVQLVHEGRAEVECAELARFASGLGLPVTLASLGLAEPSESDLDAIITPTLAAPHIRHLRAPIDRDILAGCFRRADALLA
ncbi:glycerol dehydrogenase [Elioraea rosea]|uniref:glycerol dehydrogenase n=1 Tax=Elioraea rosea TaxID=2492390 RepID=UPI0011825675|nr:glycerol dehydrogenase [Elioraea rosea]